MWWETLLLHIASHQCHGRSQEVTLQHLGFSLADLAAQAESARGTKAEYGKVQSVDASTTMQLMAIHSTLCQSDQSKSQILFGTASHLAILHTSQADPLYAGDIN